MKKHNFSAGPCILYPEVIKGASEAINNFKELAEKINLDFNKNMKEKSNLSKIENYGEEILKQTYNELKEINKNEI